MTTDQRASRDTMPLWKRDPKARRAMAYLLSIGLSADEIGEAMRKFNEWATTKDPAR